MEKILDFRNRSYSDVSGKYQNMEKALKHQRRLGLGKVREFHFQSGKSRKNEKSHGKVRENQSFSEKVAS